MGQQRHLLEEGGAGAKTKLVPAARSARGIQEQRGAEAWLCKGSWQQQPSPSSVSQEEAPP